MNCHIAFGEKQLVGEQVRVDRWLYGTNVREFNYWASIEAFKNP